LLLAVGIDQPDQRSELYTFAGVVGSWAELAPIGHRLADGFGEPFQHLLLQQEFIHDERLAY
jgi:hypothetical protein